MWSNLVEPGFYSDPFETFRRMQRDLNRWFDAAPVRSGRAYPPVNVWIEDEEAVLTAEVPGVDPKELDITVIERTVQLHGRHGQTEAPDGARLVRGERRRGDFRREVELPFAIEADRIEAFFRNGILTLRMPRAEREKPKRIPVST